MRTLPYEDEEFIRGRVPMTKKEIRILTTGFLGIGPKDSVLDIGAGTGGLTLEAARMAGHVTAVERNPDAVALIHQNKKKLGAKNISVITGKAPEALPKDVFDCIIIGGSGGSLTAIVQWSAAHLKPNGRICANFVSPENAVDCLRVFRTLFNNVQMVQINAARAEQIGAATLMKAQNPIFILSAVSKQTELQAWPASETSAQNAPATAEALEQHSEAKEQIADKENGNN